jgi:hypothetical protein
MPIVYANLEKFLSCTVSSSRMWGNEEPEKSSTIRYTEFEKRIIRRSSNLYKGYWFPYGGYMLSSCYVGVSIVFPLVSLGLCLGRPTLSSILLLSSLLLTSIHYFLGVLIVQFRVRRRIMLFSALLTLLLSWGLFFSFVFLSAGPPPDIVTQAILIALFMAWPIPWIALSTYFLVQAYRGKYDEALSRITRQQQAWKSLSS